MMLVMTTQAEFATAEIPSSVRVAKPRHVEDLPDIGSIQGRLNSGQAFLKVVAYPWGVEFDVCDSEESR
jgi:hypothetical protein